MRDVYVGALISTDYLEHYGKAHDENPPGRGSGRYAWGSGERPHQHVATLRKGTKFVRYSDKNEKSIRNTTYVSYDKHDIETYKKNAMHGQLGNDPNKALYKIQIKAVDPIRIASARQVTEDVMQHIAKRKFFIFTNALELDAKKAFEKLIDAGFYDETKNVNQRHDIFYKTLQDGYGHDMWWADQQRRNLADQIHKVVYKNRDEFAKKYKDMGYDAITDPEDWAYIYEHPLIIVNNKKFMVIGSEKLKSTKPIKHSDESDGRTIGEIFDTFNDEQKNALYAYLASSMTKSKSSSLSSRRPGKTIGDVFSTLNEDQRNVVDAIVGYAKTQKKYVNKFRR